MDLEEEYSKEIKKHNIKEIKFNSIDIKKKQNSKNNDSENEKVFKYFIIDAYCAIHTFPGVMQE